MIVSSMALIEIHNELFKDLATLTNKIMNCHKEFRRRVLKASRYPFSYSYECYSRLNKNRFILTFIAMKRSDYHNPTIGVRCLYNRAEGLYAAVISMENGTTTIFPPHFFKRYRERIVKDFSASSDDIIKRYFSGIWGFTFTVLNNDIRSLYHGFEDEMQGGGERFVCAMTDGYCFGERYGKIHLMKTIISEEMLFESQKEVLGNLRKDFVKVNAAMYGNKNC